MTGKLLVRFDDICPTMNWAVWEEIEQALAEFDVKPLVAVIPDNRDPTLELSAPRRDFWNRVRAWRAQGWTIGVHGYQHAYVTRSAGMLGITPASEFAGLPLQEQERKIRLAAAIFRNEGLDPKVWVAPSHSFDETTLKVLPEAGLSIVSDGLAVFPHEGPGGMFWVPQQMWRFRAVPFGVWTVCMHHNVWGPGVAALFREQLREYRARIASFDEVVAQYKGRRRSALDGMAGAAMSSALGVKRALRQRAAAAKRAEVGA